MSISLDTPIAEALSSAVHSKIVEEGWTQDDDTSLAEYIVLMLANGKTQDQIASELAGELLQDAKGTTEFSQWLFDQVNLLSGGSATAPAEASQPSDQSTTFGVQTSDATDNGTSSIPAAYDMDMVDNAPENAPRGPKGLHGGRPAGRGGRGGIVNKSADTALHRVRGSDRINSHNVRGAPKGPRSANRETRPGMQKALNGMGMTGPQGMNAMMMNGANQGQGMMQMSPHQQMEFMAMMEQQTRMLAQFTGMMPGSPTGFQQGQQSGQGRSLFDRVEPGRGRGGGRGRGRGALGQNGHIKSPTKMTGDGDTNMEGDSQSAAGEANTIEGQEMGDADRKPSDPSTTMCHFNLRCTNADCAFVHQSPAAPDGTIVDLSEPACSFGPACKNAKCVAKHPSPAKVRAFQAQETCKFFPNCTKPNCPFKHPSMPVCKFGASCKTQNCPFTHLQTACRFNPCTNLKCPYKHEPGQQKTTNFSDYSWTPEKQAEQDAANDHLSDRKFVDEQAGSEELIKPEGNMEIQSREEVIT